MSAIRTTLAAFIALLIGYGVEPGTWRDASFLALGWWLAWSAYAAPRFSEIMRRIGLLIEDMT